MENPELVGRVRLSDQLRIEWLLTHRLTVFRTGFSLAFEKLGTGKFYAHGSAAAHRRELASVGKGRRKAAIAGALTEATLWI
jgi:hypothetical protein